MNRAKQHAGKIGGLTTLARHGYQHFEEIGKLGGRPKLPALSQTVDKETQKEDKLPNGLKELKRLWLNRVGALGSNTPVPSC